jgi:hypothetical protein
VTERAPGTSLRASATCSQGSGNLGLFDLLLGGGKLFLNPGDTLAGGGDLGAARLNASLPCRPPQPRTPRQAEVEPALSAAREEPEARAEWAGQLRTPPSA